MKPIIGVITRPIFSEEKNKMDGVYSEIKDAILENGGIPIGILSIKEDWQDVLLKCDGIIFQGGDEWQKEDIDYLKFAYENDIPTLGICLGMQMMAWTFDALEYEVLEHKQKGKLYVHDVIIKKDSKLYKILKEEKITVNSRHKFAIKNPKLNISAMSIDGVIEAIEDQTKKFFIGVQWHPESMIAYDKVAQRLFKAFVNICRK